MSYEKYTWQNGDVITAQKLNHMEDGIGSCGVLCIACEIDYNEESFGTPTATITQAFDAINNNIYPILFIHDSAGQRGVDIYTFYGLPTSESIKFKNTSNEYLMLDSSGIGFVSE